MEKTVTLKDVLELATKLSLKDKLRLIEQVAPQIEQALPERTVARKSLYGICAHLGQAPSAEEIDAARKEAWANFPRDDI